METQKPPEFGPQTNKTSAPPFRFDKTLTSDNEGYVKLSAGSLQPVIWLPAVLAAVIALVLFAITLRGTYVYDDTTILEDPRYSHVEQWGRFWTQDYWAGAVDKLYRPLTCMSFAVQYAVHGDRPIWFHLVNLLLHAAVAAMVAELGRRLMGFRVGCAAGVLFAVHPIHVEAVAGLVGRAELLCAGASVLGMILFLKPMSPGRVVAIAVCFVVAALSKEQGILLPAMLLALTPYRRRLLNSHSTSDNRAAERGVGPVPSSRDPLKTELLMPDDYRRSAAEITPRLQQNPKPEARNPNQIRMTNDPIPNEKREVISAALLRPGDKMGRTEPAMQVLAAVLCLLMAAYIVIRERLLGFTWDRQQLDWAINPLIRATGSDRVLMPLVLVGRYLLLLVAPRHLSLDYGAKVIGWMVDWRQPYVYLGAVAVAMVGALLIWTVRRRQWALVFCLACFGLTYGMVSNSVMLIGTIMGERLMYLPSVFFLILVAALLSRLLHPRLFVACVAILATLGGVRTFTYARMWNDPMSLYQDNLRREPMSMQLHGLVAYQDLQAGKFREARETGGDALAKFPDCLQAYVICVNADLKMHNFADAHRVLSYVDRRVSVGPIGLLRKQVAQEEAASLHPQ